MKVAIIVLMLTNNKTIFVSVSVVIGIPTIKRERESYLTQTLTSLLDSLNDEEKLDALIVVFVAEVRQFLSFD